MQGISEALGWAEARGQTFEHQRHEIAMLVEERTQHLEEIKDLKNRLLKLAADFQGVIQENEKIRAAANEQAVALTSEVETLKKKLAAMKQDADIDPLMRRALPLSAID